MIKIVGIFFILVTAFVAHAENAHQLCAPDLSNNSAIGGRLTVQPLALTVCDRTLALPDGKFQVKIGYAQTTDSNNIAGFGSKDYHGVNLATDKVQLAIAFGKIIGGHKFEIGGRYTEYLDSRANLATKGANAVHSLIQKYRFIGKDSDPVGAHIGKVDVSDEVNRAVEGFIKYNPFQDAGTGGLFNEPNVAATLMGKVPVSGSPLDAPGLGLSIDARKDINRWLAIMGGVAYSCNTLKPGAFKSDDIRVKMCAADFYIGGAVTIWRKENSEGKVTDQAYVQGAFMAQENRITMASNPVPAPLFNKVVSFGLRYQKNDEFANFDCGVSFTEGLEPRPRSFQDDATLTLDCVVSKLEGKQLLQKVKSKFTR